MDLSEIKVYDLSRNGGVMYITYFDSQGDRDTFYNKNRSYLGKKYLGNTVILKELPSYQNQDKKVRYPLVIA